MALSCVSKPVKPQSGHQSMGVASAGDATCLAPPQFPLRPPCAPTVLGVPSVTARARPSHATSRKSELFGTACGRGPCGHAAGVICCAGECAPSPAVGIPRQASPSGCLAAAAGRASLTCQPMDLTPPAPITDALPSSAAPPSASALTVCACPFARCSTLFVPTAEAWDQFFATMVQRQV